MKSKKALISIFTLSTVLLVAVLLMAGCASKVETATPEKSGNTAPPAAVAPPTPVELTFYPQTLCTLSDEEFASRYSQPVKKKFPNITMKKVDCLKGSLTDLAAGGNLPDIMLVGVTNMLNFLDVNLPLDLNAPMKEGGIDLQKIDPKVVGYVRSFGEHNEMFAMPIYLNTFATFYNKSIFDKFGVTYPKDGMTWPDMIDLAKKLSRTDNGTPYYGLQMRNTKRLQTQMALDFVDPKTSKSLIQSAGWRTFFETWKQMNDVPGNLPGEKDFLGGALNMFVKDQNLAMLADIQLSSDSLESLSKSGSDWDVVSFPVFKEKPKVGVGVGADALIVTRGSKHVKEAVNALSVYLSNEVQDDWTKQGFLTVLNNNEIKKNYMLEKPLYKGKNTKAFYYNEIADAYRVSPYDDIAKKTNDAALKEYIYGKKDLNTVLRETEEATNKLIEAEKH
jgi:multiple sugar transport system substrate-binding protein